MAKLTFDFSNVEDNGGVAAGKYIAKVEEITQHDGKEAPYLKWKLKLLTGASKGMHVNHITSLKPSALFNLRNTLIACGFDVPKSAVALDINKLVGKQLGVEVVLKEADNGNEYPNVKKTFPAKELVAASSVSVGVGTSKATPSVPPMPTDDDDDEVTLDIGGDDDDLPFN